MDDNVKIDGEEGVVKLGFGLIFEVLFVIQCYCSLWVWKLLFKFEGCWWL